MPLYSTDAEMSTLGSMLLSKRAAEEVSAVLEAADFYLPPHQFIFEAIFSLLENDAAIDVLTVSEVLKDRNQLDKVGGLDYLVSLAESVPTASNVLFYADIVRDKSMLRRLQDVGREIAGLAPQPERTAEEKVDEAERRIFEIRKNRLGKDFEHIKSLAYEFFTDIDRIIETKEPNLGVPTGFYDLDEITMGFQPGDLVIVAARPAMGKTSLVLNFAVHVAHQQIGNVAIFSLEMSSEQLVRRLVSMESGVTGQEMRQPNITKDQYQALANACDSLSELPLYIDDQTDITSMAMKGKCRRLRENGGLSLVVVDYLQLMRSMRQHDNRVQEVGEIARSLKGLARELKVPVVALSQLSRQVEARVDKRPLLSDLRESGSIEAEADMVMMLYREAYYKATEDEDGEPAPPLEIEEAEVIIAKHRNGPTGKVVLGFQPRYTRFVNLKR
jgi:replicative DNA helicase